MTPWYLKAPGTGNLLNEVGGNRVDRNMPEAFRRALSTTPKHWEKPKRKKHKKK